jgi:hypothetical protein
MDAIRLLLNAWYKVLAYFGPILFAVGLTIGIPGLTREEVLFISSGMCLFGLGVWYRREGIVPFRPLDVMGILLLGIGVWKIAERL